MLPFFNTLTLTPGHSTPLRSSLSLTLQLHLSLLLFRQKRHQSRQHNIPSTGTMYSPLLMLFTLLRKPSLPASRIFTKSILFLHDPSSAESHHMCPVTNLTPLSPLNPHSILRSRLHLFHSTLCQSELCRFLPFTPAHERPENRDDLLLPLCVLNTQRCKFDMPGVAVRIRSRFSYI